MLAGTALLTALSSRPAWSQSKSEPPSTRSVRFHDDFRRVALWEYLATAGVLGGAVALRFLGPEPPDNFRGGVLFDDAIVRRVTLENPRLAGDVRSMTDALYLGSMAYRFVDSAIVPLAGYGDFDLTTQMFMIDVESFSLVAGVLFSTQVFVGRQRPDYDQICDGSVSSEEQAVCRARGSRLRSFIAGHPAVALAAAGLTCTHHAHLPLYGGWGDTLACGLMIGSAAFTGAGRVLTGKHYPTDLVLGYALGAFSGFVLPRLLHYGFSDRKRPKQSTAPRHEPFAVGLRPWFDGSRFGLSAVGSF